MSNKRKRCERGLIGKWGRRWFGGAAAAASVRSRNSVAFMFTGREGAEIASIVIGMPITTKVNLKRRKEAPCTSADRKNVQRKCKILLKISAAFLPLQKPECRSGVVLDAAVSASDMSEK